jgi:hypothetical protein
MVRDMRAKVVDGVVELLLAFRPRSATIHPDMHALDIVHQIQASLSAVSLYKPLTHISRCLYSNICKVLYICRHEMPIGSFHGRKVFIYPYRLLKLVTILILSINRHSALA